MVRMAERLAENFIPEARNESEPAYSRYKGLWCLIIIAFVILVLVQCYSQIKLYISEPVATNIEAEYPSKISFPTVAICNNNQFRLTYLTGGRIMNRRSKSISGSLLSTGHDIESVFDTVLRKSWDMDAVKFLRSAAHWKSRMILGCTWPNGTSCKLSDFKAVWTTTGLCWAINSDPHNPYEVTGSGEGHGLRLLLNVESYERVDACTKHFRTKSLPGLKILIYNQTDVPDSSMNGVNVPSGYSMDIPFKMQHRSKLPGVHCIEENDEQIEASTDFNNPENVRTCTLRRYMTEVENSCHCTLRRAYTSNSTNDLKMAACNVDQYFGCAQEAMKRVREEGTASTCLPPCKSIDYTAWQDMNRLPQNLMPALIEEQEEDDEDDVEQEELDENVSFSTVSGGETFSCEDKSRPITSEEKKANQMFFLLDENGFKRNATKYMSIGDLKSRYGDKMEKLWHVFMPDSYLKSISGDFSRMDRIIELMDQYELNKLQRRAWAEKMQSRQMKHFFEDDFYESYYQPLIKDLDTTLVKQIDEVESDWPKVEYYLQRGSAGKTGAIMFFGDGKKENRQKFEKLIIEMHECASGKLRKEAGKMLHSFKKSYRELQAAYGKLFKEELPDYLENFQFGNKFVGDNFAMVNIFLHRMNLEVWSQDRTYGFWSLACDIGGALGLFLGASLLTIIEIVYLCIQYGLCGKRARNMKCIPMDKLTRQVKKVATCSCCKKEEKPREPIYKKKSQSYQRRYTAEDEEQAEKFRSRTSSEDSKMRKNIWAQMNDPSANSTLTPSEIKHFLDQVQRHSQPPSYHDDQHPEDQYYYNDPNYLGISPVPNKPDDNRESSTSGYHSFPLPPRATNPRDESPIPDTEPISVSEFSDAHAVSLFRTPPPTKRRTSSQKDQKVSDDDDFDKQSYV
ncbi:Protein CBG02656 [Caenorhabditis briggsae]|uniref:Protein CBG02656 n=1 Tax=Caenorhabditis briggsae TaxID=6238 RepID=A8WTT6_CAEBR|nr:Protein CBG02656 [Caenorhabditis briggsae]CAP23898.1 Protein CBG02656 [Caenorhabditis briggsae]